MKTYRRTIAGREADGRQCYLHDACPGSANRKSKIENQKSEGSALVIALWVVLLLSTIIGFFAFDMHVEARITSYYRKRLKAIGLARAGIERAKMLLVKSSDPDILNEGYEFVDERWYADAKHLRLGGSIEGYEDKIDDNRITVRIVPEPARINVNSLDTAAEWERVFEVGDIPEEQWDELIDCFLDWQDTDDQSRTYGAETDDYYGSLEKPYMAKNGALFTVGELLLIKGFTAETLYGGTVEGEGVFDEASTISGIDDLLTALPVSKVNVNAATKRVLMTLPGVDDLVADEIIQEREGYGEDDLEEDHSFETEADFFSRPGLRHLSSQLNKLIETESQIHRITSIGEAQGVVREISCIANVNKETGEMEILRWQEQ